MYQESRVDFLSPSIPCGHIPLDLISRLGNEEALCVRLNLNVGAWVDGDAALLPVVTACLRGDQQQLQLDETHPATQTERKQTTIMPVVHYIRPKLRRRFFAILCDICSKRKTFCGQITEVIGYTLTALRLAFNADR